MSPRRDAGVGRPRPTVAALPGGGAGVAPSGSGGTDRCIACGCADYCAANDAADGGFPAPFAAHCPPAPGVLQRLVPPGRPQQPVGCPQPPGQFVAGDRRAAHGKAFRERDLRRDAWLALARHSGELLAAGIETSYGDCWPPGRTLRRVDVTGLGGPLGGTGGRGAGAGSPLPGRGGAGTPTRSGAGRCRWRLPTHGRPQRRPGKRPDRHRDPGDVRARTGGTHGVRRRRTDQPSPAPL